MHITKIRMNIEAVVTTAILGLSMLLLLPVVQGFMLPTSVPEAYAQSNANETWYFSRTGGGLTFKDVAISDDGNVMVGITDTQVWRSTNSGYDWSEMYVPAPKAPFSKRSLSSVAITPKGTQIYVADSHTAGSLYGGVILKNTTGGAFSEVYSTEATYANGAVGFYGFTGGLSVSADGQHIYTGTASLSNGTPRAYAIYSDNAGASWNTWSPGCGTGNQGHPDSFGAFAVKDSYIAVVRNTASFSGGIDGSGNNCNTTRVGSDTSVRSYYYVSYDNLATWTIFNNQSSLVSSLGEDPFLNTNQIQVRNSTSDGNRIDISDDWASTWETYRKTGVGAKKAVVAGNVPVIFSGAGYIIRKIDMSEYRWFPQTALGQRDWSAVASSADGQTLAAAESGGYIYTSTDGGATWDERQNAGSRNWTKIFVSNAGTDIVGLAQGTLYTSDDSGETWQSSILSGWEEVSAMTGGQILAGRRNNGDIYTSSDYGNTWNEVAVSGGDIYPFTVGVSSSGLVATIEDWDNYANPGLYTGPTSGPLRWTAGQFFGAFMSSGATLLGLDGGWGGWNEYSGIQASTNGGSTWNTVPYYYDELCPNDSYDCGGAINAIHLSGNSIYIASSGGYILRSDNLGKTWRLANTDSFFEAVYWSDIVGGGDLLLASASTWGQPGYLWSNKDLNAKLNASLTIKAEIKNDNGGTSKESDINFTIKHGETGEEYQVTAGKGLSVPPGSYTIEKITAATQLYPTAKELYPRRSWYDISGTTGGDRLADNAVIEVSSGGTSFVVSFDDRPAQIRVIKTVDNWTCDSTSRGGTNECVTSKDDVISVYTDVAGPLGDIYIGLAVGLSNSLCGDSCIVTENKPDIFETDYTMLDDFGILNSTQKTSGPTYISSGTTQNVPAGVYKIRWPEFRETYSTLGGQSCYDQGNKNSQYGVLTVEPGGFYDCRILFVAKLIGGGGPDNPTIDYCANLDGIQSTIPEGMSLDNYGNCTSNGVDMCTNIIGIQSVIPDGLFADGVGGCVATPPVDMCPNIDGVQVVIPSGYVLNGVGACVPVDFCPNVAGIQTTMPDGYAVDTSGDCVPTCDPAVDADCPDPDYFGFTLSTIPAIDTYIGNTVTRYTSVIKDITSGHDESIRFSVSGIPEGVTVVPVRGTCVSSDSCMFTINVTGTQEVPGASFTVTAISETGKIASTDVSITIGANPNTDFDFSLSPVGSQNIPVGTSVKVYTKATVTIPGKKNNPKVDMTISNIRNMSGASAGGIEVTSISSGKNCSFTCTFNMDIKGITEGSYIFTITGVSEGVTHAMDVQVTVSPRAFDFSLSDPTNIVLYRGSTLSSSQQNISAKKAEGSSWDEGIQFSMSPTTAGGLTITTVKDGSCTTLVSLCEYVKNFSAPSTATLGEYTFDVTAVSTGVSKITRTKTFTVEVKDKVCLNGETLVNGECVASCTLQVDGCNVNECPVGYIWDNGSCKKGGSTYSCNTQGQFVVNKVCVFCFGVGCSPIQPNDNDNACSIKEKRGTNTVYEVNPTDTGYTYYWYDFLYPAGQGPFSGTASEYSSSANRVSVVAMSPNNLMKIYHCPDTSKYKRDIKYEEF